MKKKIITVCLLLSIISALAIGGTLAYFTDNETKENVFVMGEVDIELTETEWTAPDKVYPGIAYDKNPVVKNVGDDAAWIRVDVTLSDAQAFIAAATKYEIDDLSVIFIGHDEQKWTLAEKNRDTAKDTLTYSYYYNDLLSADASTEAIFTQVKIPGQFNVADMAAIGDNFTITIQAHAMQTADDYDTVQEAFDAYIFEAKVPLQ